MDWNFYWWFICKTHFCRTPRWVRGLKYHQDSHLCNLYFVAPHDGCVDWNLVRGLLSYSPKESHPTMGAWIEINHGFHKCNHQTTSHPTMGAWIEIWNFLLLLQFFFRRTPRWVRGLKYIIASIYLISNWVAPHDGCVDWNNVSLETLGLVTNGRTPRWVRGLKLIVLHTLYNTYTSHPTMGAWIEIQPFSHFSYSSTVAPHDGCVDWNFLQVYYICITYSRTPRWVRGLKSSPS